MRSEHNGQDSAVFCPFGAFYPFYVVVLYLLELYSSCGGDHSHQPPLAIGMV
jgi:hypothetical protein